jgi:hypothetical protein
LRRILRLGKVRWKGAQWLVGLTVTLACLSSQGLAGILAGPITNNATGHIYYLLTQSTWTASQQEALLLGGNLVTIEDLAENDWVRDTFCNFGGQRRMIWIGLNSEYHYLTFTWISGETAAFRYWATSMPQANTSQQYVYMQADTRTPSGGWVNYLNNNADLGLPIHGVVEVVPRSNALRIRVSEVELDFDTAPGKTYQLEYRSDLTINVWTSLGPPVTGTGLPYRTNDIVALGQPRRFYRLVTTTP